jgi:geranylgeranyl pyrophosphate synthase
MTEDSSQMRASLESIIEPVHEELEQLEAKLETVFSTKIDLLFAIGKHLTATRGKRVRPILVFLSARMGKPRIDQVVVVAAAVEIVHTATLLHDDSLDRSDLRRGLPTVNKLWDDHVSVIMGDHLFCTAFKLLHRAGLPEIAEVLACGSSDMTFGEVYQMDLRGDFDVSESEYLGMIRNKTGALFATACKAGAIVGGLDRDQVSRLEQYGESVGTAFQITDDVLDFVGDPEVMGKPVGNDIRDGKATLPLIAALREVTDEDAAAIKRRITADGFDAVRWKRIVEFIVANGGVDYAQRLAAEHAERAKTLINGMQSCPARESLLALADMVVSRRR